MYSNRYINETTVKVVFTHLQSCPTHHLPGIRIRFLRIVAVAGVGRGSIRYFCYTYTNTQKLLRVLLIYLHVHVTCFRFNNFIYFVFYAGIFLKFK